MIGVISVIRSPLGLMTGVIRPNSLNTMWFPKIVAASSGCHKFQFHEETDQGFTIGQKVRVGADHHAFAEERAFALTSVPAQQNLHTGPDRINAKNHAPPARPSRVWSFRLFSPLMRLFAPAITRQVRMKLRKSPISSIFFQNIEPARFLSPHGA